MDNHGIARVPKAPRTEEQRVQELEKIKKYRDLETSIREQASQDAYHDPALFQLTTKLLRLNPEYYTIWNVRRRCLISGLLSKPSAGSWPSKGSPSSSPNTTTKTSCAASSPSSSDATPPDQNLQTTGQSGTTADETAAKNEEKDEAELESDINVLQSELAFTVPLLMEFPKCYWLWKYRKWLLEEAIIRLPAPAARKIWEAELALDSKMLTKDRRNFHAWGYRRYVVAKLETPALLGKSMAEDEFAYTTKMIPVDLSNFSNWHHRSLLMLRVLNERGADDESRKAILEKELDTVREGLNVGPEDQSLWYYQRYLISQVCATPGKTGMSIAPNLTVQERIAYLTREIEEIKDLLEDYKDIKWIYKALLEYTISLRRLRHGEGEETIEDDPRQCLVKLRELDPMQKGRWDDVERQLDNSTKDIAA
ncbi:hypothetical protein F4780DRAFT_742133 [Xylariomycetidae sp. FL0641]|nr:hypothetical protein F4780DRAFT_742133 [Xylariomycetidae sp. FL0641]